MREDKERGHRAFLLTKKKGTAKPLLQPSQDCAHTNNHFHSPGSSVIPTKLCWPEAARMLLSLPCCISAKPHTLLLLLLLQALQPLLQLQVFSLQELPGNQRRKGCCQAQGHLANPRWNTKWDLTRRKSELHKTILKACAVCTRFAVCCYSSLVAIKHLLERLWLFSKLYGDIPWGFPHSCLYRGRIISRLRCDRGKHCQVNVSCRHLRTWLNLGSYMPFYRRAQDPRKGDV